MARSTSYPIALGCRHGGRWGPCPAARLFPNDRGFRRRLASGWDALATGVSIMTDARPFWLGAGLLLVLGCGALIVWLRHESGPTLTGAIRVDGKLLSKGSIALAPIEGTLGPGGGGGIDDNGK